MFQKSRARTGIEFGTSSVKLVRGEGDLRLKRVTHAAAEPWDGLNREDRVDRAGSALRDLLHRTGLGRSSLGRIAVSAGWQENSVRETEMPPITPQELAQALPYEARNHLDLETMESPVLAGQILETSGAEGEEGVTTRVLLAAVPRPRRDFVLEALERAGLEPEVVDLEPMAGLNVLFAEKAAEFAENEAVGLLDIGAHHTALHIAAASGGLLTRNVAPGAPSGQDSPVEQGYLMKLSSGVEQTLTFFRGRHRREIGVLYAAGGGARVPARLEALQAAIGRPVHLLLPAAGLGNAGRPDGEDLGPEYLTACGLCRWGDEGDV